MFQSLILHTSCESLCFLSGSFFYYTINVRPFHTTQNQAFPSILCIPSQSMASLETQMVFVLNSRVSLSSLVICAPAVFT